MIYLTISKKENIKTYNVDELINGRHDDIHLQVDSSLTITTKLIDDIMYYIKDKDINKNIIIIMLTSTIGIDPSTFDLGIEKIEKYFITKKYINDINNLYNIELKKMLECHNNEIIKYNRNLKINKILKCI